MNKKRNNGYVFPKWYYFLVSLTHLFFLIHHQFPWEGNHFGAFVPYF